MGVIIIGSGGFGKEVLDFLRQKNEKIIGFISNDRGSVSGIPILGGDEILPDLIRQQK